MEIRNLKLVIVVVVLLALIVPIFQAHAGLVVCGNSEHPDACTPCDLITQVKAILDFITLTIVPVLGFVLVVMAGFIIVLGGASPEMVSTGRKMLTNTIIGAIIVYSAFILTNFILKSLVGDSDISKNWFKIECVDNTTGASNTAGGGGVLPVAGTNPARDAQIRKTLDDAKIGYNPRCGTTSGACADFDNVRDQTIQEAINLKRDCEAAQRTTCKVYINGASEGDHDGGVYSHANGYKIDIARDTWLDDYISGSATKGGTRTENNGSITQLYYLNGNEYALEQIPPHWDVLVK